LPDADKEDGLRRVEELVARFAPNEAQYCPSEFDETSAREQSSTASSRLSAGMS
jgi:hypothetical protein